MSVFTIGQNQTLQQHLTWCRDLIAENERSIEMFGSGKMKIGRNGEDMTSEWIATLKRQNESLQRVVAAFEPAKFQSQVK